MGNAHDGWIGVDFDGTLATYEEWISPDHCGAPIEAMVVRVKQWIAEGRNVRIVTARVYAPHNKAQRQADAARSMLAIQEWCSKHLGTTLPVTCVKDFSMIELWDDRSIQLERNTGRRVDSEDEQ